MTENHTFDELDFQLLHALQVDGRASFSRLAQVLCVSDQTIARRFRRLSSDMQLRIVGVRDAQLLGHDTWMLRLRVRPDGADAVARALARRDDTSWIGLTSAGTEIVCSISFSRAGDHEELVLGRLPRTPSIADIRAHQVLHRFFGGPSGWFGKETALEAERVAALTPAWARYAGAAPAPAPAAVPRREAPDAADEAVLRALERDGRAPLAELARVAGVSESAARRRLERLLGSGSVYIDAEYSPAAIGFTTRALLWLGVEPRSLDGVGRALSAQPETAAVFATTGPSNLAVVIVCRDVAEVYRYVSGAVGSLDGVSSVDVSPVLRTVKQLTYDDGAERRRPGA
ncbi:Lrp/AsnC family transcriptional regulator [Streptomyces fuscigenes]|uniref:Lrp/AsnC family transcriptional regulator n=1 Tax=Streptomyces fuscigenes TaxID=1528880 RepID=UPI001F31EBE3|nr:AsnC family transcriptional regulator [Streptomyces fuscigenes]MCF3962577.1 AsnC family transcriptional regulator [Streptomyces fuscigenes]